MKKKLVRLTSWCLAMIMVLSILPVTALPVMAENAGASTVTEIVTEVETMPAPEPMGTEPAPEPMGTEPAPEPDVSEPAVGTVVVEPGAEYVYIYLGKFFLCLKNTSESAVTLVGEFDENGYSISADSVLKLAAGQTVVVQRCRGELDAPEVQYESAYTAATACELGIGKSSTLPWLVSGNLTVDPGVYLFLQNVYMKNETSEPITVTPSGAKVMIPDDGSIIFGTGYMESQWTRYWGGTATFFAVNPHIKSSNNRPFIKIDAGDKVKTQQMRPQDLEAFAELSAGKNDCIFSNSSNSSGSRYTIYTDLAIDGVLFTNVIEDTPITTINVIWRGENHFSLSGVTGRLIRVSIPAE